MDQQTKRGLGAVRPAETGVRAGLGRDLLALALSLAAILLVTVALAGLAAGTAFLAAWAIIGMRGLRSFYFSVLFDLPLLSELNALAVSFAYICLAAAVLLVARRLAGPAWREALAWRPAAGRWQGQWLVPFMVLAYGLGVGCLLAWAKSRHVPFDGPADRRLIAIIMLNLVVLAPLAEELLFRGWTYSALRKRLGPWPVIGIVSALFAAFHAEPRHMLLVLPLGVALGVWREHRGSIKPTILLHAAYNLVTIGVTLALQ